jgi:hypothetical protein
MWLRSESIRQLLASSKHSGVGVIVFLARCEEIKRLVADCELDDEDYAIQVSATGAYAQRTRFIPNSLTKHFQSRYWPHSKAEDAAKRAARAPIDVQSKMRRMWG